jgi:hypothetical protein
MDVNRGSTIDEAQPGNQCKTIDGKDQCIVWNKQSVGSGAIVGGQRCFFMDIQISKRESTKVSTTQN